LFLISGLALVIAGCVTVTLALTESDDDIQILSFSAPLMAIISA
jgi:starvation-inducible outer membrane lipoprotein